MELSKKIFTFRARSAIGGILPWIWASAVYRSNGWITKCAWPISLFGDEDGDGDMLWVDCAGNAEEGVLESTTSLNAKPISWCFTLAFHTMAQFAGTRKDWETLATEVWREDDWEWSYFCYPASHYHAVLSLFRLLQQRKGEDHSRQSAFLSHLLLQIWRPCLL